MALNLRIEMRMRTDNNHTVVATFFGYNDNNTVTVIELDRLGAWREKIEILVQESYQRGSRLIYLVQYMDDKQQGDAQMVYGPWGAAGNPALQVDIK
jgi:beta-glucanase (GH16 family)